MWFPIDSCATGERGPLQSHRRIQISPNVSINAQWRAVTAQKAVSVYPCTQRITHFTHVSMVWSNQAPVACLYPGKVALHKRIRHPRPPVTGGDRSGSAGEEVNKLKKHRNERQTSSSLCAMEMETRKSPSLSLLRQTLQFETKWVEEFQEGAECLGEVLQGEREKHAAYQLNQTFKGTVWAADVMMSSFFVKGSESCVIWHVGISNVCYIVPEM